MLSNNKTGYFPYTPATNLLYGLRESLAMLEEEGCKTSSPPCAPRGEHAARGARLGPGDPVRGAGGILELAHRGDDAAGHDADALRKIILEAYDMCSAPAWEARGKVFRSDTRRFNDLMLAGTSPALKWGLRSPVCRTKSGVLAALDHLPRARVAAPRKPRELPRASAIRRAFFRGDHEIRKMEHACVVGADGAGLRMGTTNRSRSSSPRARAAPRPDGEDMQAPSRRQPDEAADGRVAEGRASGAEALIYMKSSAGTAQVLIAYSLIYMCRLGQDRSTGASSRRFPSSRSTSLCCGQHQLPYKT